VTKGAAANVDVLKYAPIGIVSVLGQRLTNKYRTNAEQAANTRLTASIDGGHMSDATIVALVILVGVFILMSVTVLKAGAEAAIKMWGVMGALTGVAFGAITSYYFTNKTHEETIAQMGEKQQQLEMALQTATRNASAAQTLVEPFYAALKGENDTAAKLPAGLRCVASMPEGDRQSLELRFAKTTNLLDNITAGEVVEAAAAQ
jgi:hypothetical protein